MDVNIDWATAFTYTRDALSLLKDMKDLLPAGKKQDEAAEKIEAAERRLQLAEASVAQGLGYHLCQCVFPPSIMLKTGNNGRQDIFTCAKCNSSWPPPSESRPTFITHAPSGGSWMAR